MINLSYKRACVWKQSPTWSCCIPSRFEPPSTPRSWTWPCPVLYTWSPLLECTPLFRFYPASPGHDRDLVPSPSRNYRQQRKQENSDCEPFSGHYYYYYLGAEARTTSMTARSWSEIKLHVSAVISRLFQIIWFAKTVLTIQKWNCRLEIKTKQMSSTLVILRRWWDENGCQMYKNENRSCKAC